MDSSELIEYEPSIDEHNRTMVVVDDTLEDINQVVRNVAVTLNNAIDLKLQSNNGAIEANDVEQAVDMVDALTKLLAVHHKGREVSFRHQ